MRKTIMVIAEALRAPQVRVQRGICPPVHPVQSVHKVHLNPVDGVAPVGTVDRLDERTCGVWVMDVRSGRTVAWVKLGGRSRKYWGWRYCPKCDSRN